MFDKKREIIYFNPSYEYLVAQIVSSDNLTPKTQFIPTDKDKDKKATWGYITGNIEAQADLFAIIQNLQNQIDSGISGDITDKVYLKNEIDDIINTVYQNLQTGLDTKVDITVYDEDKTETNESLTSILARLQELQIKIDEVKKQNTEVLVLYEGHDTTFENKEKDYIINGVIMSRVDFKGNSVTIDDVTINAAPVYMIAADEIQVKDTSVTGIIPKIISDCIISARADKYVTVKDCTFNMENCFNVLEIGKNTGLAKCIVIDNIDFGGLVANNAINVYGMADGGILNITNCHFDNVSNILRLTNRGNTSWTVNIINCTCDNWETGLYGGAILLQDDTSLDADAANANDMFSKLTINIQNLTKPDGTKLIMPTDLSTICATGDDNQIIYMYDDYRGITSYGDKYPIINIS